ncbi:hypothetical protein ACTMS0_20650 [Micromonospora sp. H33]|uniref:hypothetical protein n=1 Tax=Micromonospora sp. H33 TaxID=3452215 RepID=UPI003F8B589C
MTPDRMLSPSPDWPPMNARSAPTPPPRATLLRPPAPPVVTGSTPTPTPPGGSGEWWPYPMFGGITLLVGCLALIVVALT